MVDMFTNYQNLSDYYIPNNLSKNIKTPCSYSKLQSIEDSKPFELYNAKGELEGYTWYYGNKLVLDFDIDGEIRVEGNAIVYTSATEEPSVETEGRIGQKAYNIIDHKCWKCVGYTGRYYIWQIQENFVYPINGQRCIYIDVADYMKDKIVTFNIFNFRLENIYNINLDGSANIKIYVDDELAKLLVKGIYYCSLEVAGPDTHETIFSPEDCKIVIK